MKKERKKRLYLKPFARIILIIFLLFLLSFSSYYLYYGYNPKNINNKSIYTTNGTSTYKVYLVPNNFYDEKYLDMNKQYTSELIDYIDIDFNYIFNNSKIGNIKYNYDVIATIKGEYENDASGKSDLWTKKYVLLNNTSKEKNNTTNFNINKNIKINYKEYNDVVNDFKSNFRLAIDAYLNVKLRINYEDDIKDMNNKLKNSDIVELNIPLTSNTMKITTNNINTKKEFYNNKYDKDINKLKVGYILLIISIIYMLIFMPSIIRTKKDLYLEEIKKIMKNYAEIIVEVNELPDIDDLNIIDIKTFDDMVDLEEELKIPIFYFETIYNNESWFMIINDNTMYRYIIDRKNI